MLALTAAEDDWDTDFSDTFADDNFFSTTEFDIDVWDAFSSTIELFVVLLADTDDWITLDLDVELFVALFETWTELSVTDEETEDFFVDTQLTLDTFELFCADEEDVERAVDETLTAFDFDTSLAEVDDKLVVAAALVAKTDVFFELALESDVEDFFAENDFALATAFTALSVSAVAFVAFFVSSCEVLRVSSEEFSSKKG